MEVERAELARFETLMLPHLDAAHTLARYLTRDAHDAEDVVQEAYVRALKYFDGFRGTAARAWLLSIVRNTAHTWQRRQRGAEFVEFDEVLHSDVDEAEPADAGLLREVDQAQVQRALDALPLEFREVIVLREVQDLSYREIADVLEVPVGTVMSRLARARQRLARALSAVPTDRT